jgi:hypothetical protein
MIAAEATPPDDPGEGAFDHPSSGQRLKPWRKQAIPLDLGADRGTSRPRWGTLRRRTICTLQPRCTLSQVISWPAYWLSPHNSFMVGKIARTRSSMLLARGSIGMMRAGDLDGQQMALRVHQQLPFPAPNFFSVGAKGPTER